MQLTPNIATWCAPCQQQQAHLASLEASFPSLDLNYLPCALFYSMQLTVQLFIHCSLNSVIHYKKDEIQIQAEMQT